MYFHFPLKPIKYLFHLRGCFHRRPNRENRRNPFNRIKHISNQQRPVPAYNRIHIIRIFEPSHSSPCPQANNNPNDHEEADHGGDLELFRMGEADHHHDHKQQDQHFVQFQRFEKGMVEHVRDVPEQELGQVDEVDHQNRQVEEEHADL